VERLQRSLQSQNGWKEIQGFGVRNMVYAWHTNLNVKLLLECLGEEFVFGQTLSGVFGKTFSRDVKEPETPWDRKTL
jgi:hypothetical protein